MKKQNAEKFYDNLADKYEVATQNAWTAPTHIESITQTLADKATTVLDIGIGTGQSIEKLFASQQFKQIEGIDTSDKMLKICKAKFPSITLQHGEFLSFSNFTLSNYDLIICCGALEFITDLNLFFQKCKTLLSDKGNLVLTFEPKISEHKIQSLAISNVKSDRVSNIDDFLTYRYDIDEFNSFATKNGFKILKSKLFVSYKKLDTDIIYSLVHLTLDKH